jgi:hypothetical protein
MEIPEFFSKSPCGSVIMTQRPQGRTTPSRPVGPCSLDRFFEWWLTKKIKI